MTEPLCRYSVPGAIISVSGREIPWLDAPETGSTMDDAAVMVRTGFYGWAVLTTLAQKTGRGTRGREWSSPPSKGLWMSLILPPPEEPRRMDGLPRLAAGVLAETLEVMTGIPFELKHPNDVVCAGRKVAGILAETVILRESVRSVILGLGLDLTVTRAEFDEAGLPDATSLLLEAGWSPEREDIIREYLGRFKPACESLFSGKDETDRTAGQEGKH